MRHFTMARTGRFLSARTPFLAYCTAVALATLILSAAAPALAMTIRFGPINQDRPLVQGDEITVDVRVDNPDEPALLSIFASISFDPEVLAYRSGVSPGALFLGIASWPVLSRASQPYVLASDPLGTVRAASFSGTSPDPQVLQSNQILARLTFAVVGTSATRTRLVSFVAPGDDIAADVSAGTGLPRNVVSIADRITFESSDEIVIAATPEPGTALLLGFGLAILGVRARVTR